MSSLARRSIRTTAAAAGIAALGIGIAGPALAAPSVSDMPELPALDTTSAPAADTAVPGMADFTKAADTAHASMPALPDAFSFEAPSGAALPTKMNAAALPAAPDTSWIVNTKGTGADVAGVPNVTSDNVGALAAFDSAKTFAGLAEQAASGKSLTANNDISN